MTPQPVRASKLTCPAFWVLFCDLFLACDRRLARELWARLYPSADVLFQLARIEDSGRHPDTIARFGKLLPPKVLLEACERVAPSGTGRPRRRDVVALEEQILQRTAADGAWV